MQTAFAEINNIARGVVVCGSSCGHRAVVAEHSGNGAIRSHWASSRARQQPAAWRFCRCWRQPRGGRAQRADYRRHLRIRRAYGRFDWVTQYLDFSLYGGGIDNKSTR